MAGVQDLRELEKDPRLFLYTSLTAGSSHIITATSRLETILKANKVPFLAIDIATDEKARKLWQRRAGGKKLPGLVKEGYVLGDLEEIEEWNEYGELKENIGPVPASGTAVPVPKLPINTTATGGSASITPKPTFDSSKMVALPGAAEIKARNNPLPISGPEDAVKPEKMNSSAAEKEKSIQTSIRFKGDAERQAPAVSEGGAVKGDEPGANKASSTTTDEKDAWSTAKETAAKPSQHLKDNSKAESGAVKALFATSDDKEAPSAAKETSVDASQPIEDDNKAESGTTEAKPSSTADSTQTSGPAATKPSTDATESSKAESGALEAKPSSTEDAIQTTGSADASASASASTDAADPEASTDAVESQSTTQLKERSASDGASAPSKAVSSTEESSTEEHTSPQDVASPVKVETQAQSAAEPEDASKSVED